MAVCAFFKRANPKFGSALAPVRAWILLTALGGLGFGQTVLSLSTGSGSPGQPVTLSLSLAATGTAPASLQWTISYLTSDFSGITAAIGSAASAANKSLTCGSRAGSLTCVVDGSNATAISNGIVANVVLTIASSTTKTSSAVAVGGTVASSAGGSALSSSAVGATVTIVQSQTWSISGSISPAANGASATVTLSGASNASTTANSSGSYTFSGLANGSYTVTPSKTGFTFSPASAQVTVNGANQTAVNFTASSSSGPPLRNNFGGFVGMQFTVGSSPLLVSSVGRVCVAGNSGTHTVELASVSSGTAVPGGSATVNMLNCTAGQFVYAALTSPVTLHPGASYYLVSNEQYGGDQWYDLGAIPPPADVSVTNAVYSGGSSWYAEGGANMSYVPPSFQYTVENTSVPQFVTGFNGTALRNNFGGYVGMQLTVGAKPLVVYSVGRVCASGNAQSHIVEFVNASTGSAVSGGSATVTMSGCQAGQFVYAALNPPITLPAGGSYYLASSEAYGGDEWYDSGSITTTAAATVSHSVYSSGGSWYPIGAVNTSYGPVSFQYDPPFVLQSNLTGSTLRNNYGGWVGMEFTTSANGMTASSLGRICVSGNTGVHEVMLVQASNHQAVSGGSVSISMSGCTAGQFTYAPLASPITLPANTAYYLVSQEIYGGDQWYDVSGVATTSGGAVNGAAYSSDGVNWNLGGGVNTSYVPPNLQ